MNQSIPSLTSQFQAPPPNPGESFRKGEFHTPGRRESGNPDNLGGKIVQKPHPWNNYFQKSSKENPQNMRQKLRKTVLKVQKYDFNKTITVKKFKPTFSMVF